MFDGERLQELLKEEKNMQLKNCIGLLMLEPTKGFEYLISLRDKVDPEAYAMYVRILSQANTRDVSLETLLKAYEGLKQEDLMTEEELQKLAEMPDILTIYRGTDAYECPPRLSWSLEKDKASIYAHGQMYKAVINKKDIFAYYCSNGEEEEIVAYVTENYDDIL